MCLSQMFVYRERHVLAVQKRDTCVGKAVLFLLSFFVIICSAAEARFGSGSGAGWADWSVGWMLISYSAVCINWMHVSSGPWWCFITIYQYNSHGERVQDKRLSRQSAIPEK